MGKGVKKSDLCRRCVYRSEKEGINQCDYCYITGHARGCPGDEHCTRFEEGERRRMPMELPTPAPSEQRMSEQALADYEIRRRQRIWGYKETLRRNSDNRK